MDDDAQQLLEQIRRLARDFPLPHPRWHRFVPLMHDVVDDLTAAVDAVATSPAAVRALAEAVEGTKREPLDAPGPSLAAARARLRELPLPAGEHPYLDEIVLALDGAAAVFVALASIPDGEERFAEARLRLDAPGGPLAPDGEAQVS
jgi:hypothetical protein